MAAKFVAAGITGSAALFAEGLHSVADCSDSVLLLVGEHVDRELLLKLRRIAEADEHVQEVKAVHTMHNGPEDVLAILVVRFRGGHCADVEEAVARVRARILREHEGVKRVYVAVNDDRAGDE